MAIEVVDGLFKTLEQAISEQVGGNFEAINAVIFPVWAAGVLLYLVVVAWEIIYSEKQVIMSEFVKHFMVISIVSFFIAGSAFYTTYIVEIVLKSGSQIANYVVGGEAGGTTGQMIDAMIESVIEIAEKEKDEFKSASMWGKFGAAMGYYAKLIILTIFAGAFIVYAAGYLIIAMVMVGLLLSMGGIFIAFSAFPSTRQMFTAWVGSCFNYILLNLGYAILFSVLIKYLNMFMEKAGNTAAGSFWKIAMIALVFAIGVFLVQQVATLVSTLTGGVGINGLTSAMGGFAGKAASMTGMGAAARGLGGLAKGGAGKAASAAGKGAGALLNRAMGKGSLKGG